MSANEYINILSEHPAAFLNHVITHHIQQVCSWPDSSPSKPMVMARMMDELTAARNKVEELMLDAMQHNGPIETISTHQQQLLYLENHLHNLKHELQDMEVPA